MIDILTQHYVTAIDCDHEARTDTVRCNCSVWTGTPQPSVGAAVRQWAEHVLDELKDDAEGQLSGLSADAERQWAAGTRLDALLEDLVMTGWSGPFDARERAALAKLGYVPAVSEPGTPASTKRKRIDWSDVVVDEGDEAP